MGANAQLSIAAACSEGCASIVRRGLHVQRKVSGQLSQVPPVALTGHLQRCMRSEDFFLAGLSMQTPWRCHLPLLLARCEPRHTHPTLASRGSHVERRASWQFNAYAHGGSSNSVTRSSFANSGTREA